MRSLGLINSSEFKQRSEHSQRFHFNSSEVRQRSERSQRFHFNTSDVKQRSGRSQRFHFSITYAREIIFVLLVLMQHSKRAVTSNL